MNYQIKNFKIEDKELWNLFNYFAKEYNSTDCLFNKSALNYFKEYEIYHGWDVQDKSFCLFNGEEPYFLFMGALMLRGNEKKYFLFSKPCLILESSELNKKQRKNISSKMSELFLNNNYLFFVDTFYKSNLMPYSYDFLLTKNSFLVKTYCTRKILIYQSEEKLWKDIRTSYKSLINWGIRELEISILTGNSISKDLIEEYRMLHFDVSGKESRSKETWNLQYEAIKEEEAFLVTGRKDGVLVSVGYFPMNKTHAFYGSSASKFSEIQKPLFHALMWKAILYCKKRNILYFETGPELNKLENIKKKVDSKNLNIAQFKAGFGGKLFLKNTIERII